MAISFTLWLWTVGAFMTHAEGINCGYFCLWQVKVETVTEVGDPKETICNAVETYKISLLVVGDQANGILQRLVSLLI